MQLAEILRKQWSGTPAKTWLAPLLAGMVFRVYTILPQQVLFIKLMVRASLCLLALIIIGSLGAGRRSE